MTDRLLLVEVQGENGAYYKAFVTDIHEDEIQLAFEKNWQPESRFPFARVRLPPNPIGTPQYEQEQEVEVIINPIMILYCTLSDILHLITEMFYLAGFLSSQ